MAAWKDFINTIAASIFLIPCTEEEILERFNQYSRYGIGKAVQALEKEAIYYKGDVMHVKKAWAKENLKEFELDFRTEAEKELDGMTDFAKQLKKKGLI